MKSAETGRAGPKLTVIEGGGRTTPRRTGLLRRIMQPRVPKAQGEIVKPQTVTENRAAARPVSSSEVWERKEQANITEPKTIESDAEKIKSVSAELKSIVSEKRGETSAVGTDLTTADLLAMLLKRVQNGEVLKEEEEDEEKKKKVTFRGFLLTMIIEFIRGTFFEGGRKSFEQMSQASRAA